MRKNKRVTDNGLITIDARTRPSKVLDTGAHLACL